LGVVIGSYEAIDSIEKHLGGVGTCHVNKSSRCSKTCIRDRIGRTIVRMIEATYCITTPHYISIGDNVDYIGLE
jgi:hypothetical protein